MKKKIPGFIIMVLVLVSVFVLSACSETQNPSKATRGETGSANSAGFVPSAASSGYASSFSGSGSANFEPAIVRKTIGKNGTGFTVKKVTLLNLTGQNIIGFTIKHSLEPQFGANMLETGDVFLLDESRDVYYDLEAALNAQAAQTPEEKAQNLYITYNVQIILADGTTMVLHDFPFNNMEKGRLIVQNGTGFLEYEDFLTGEDIVTRQHEIDANAADQAAAWAAQQEQWAQQQQWLLNRSNGHSSKLMLLRCKIRMQDVWETQL